MQVQDELDVREVSVQLGKDAVHQRGIGDAHGVCHGHLPHTQVVVGVGHLVHPLVGHGPLEGASQRGRHTADHLDAVAPGELDHRRQLVEHVHGAPIGI